MINVLVTGGRTGVEKEVVWRAMDGIGWLLPDFNLGHGAAHGVDTFVEDWCKYHGVAYTRYPIDGRLDGFKSDAPKLRNVRMFECHQPEFLIAFPGGPGTRHAFKEAERRKITILDIDIDEVGDFSIYRLKPGTNPVIILTAEKDD